MLTSNAEIRTSRPLTPEHIAQYHKDGFLIIRGFFDFDEIEPMRKACEEDPNVMGYQTSIVDTFGKVYKVTTWTDLQQSYL
ncbi:MAG: hypothetical protein ACKPE1_15200, partial [Dolichospermum sp.]